MMVGPLGDPVHYFYDEPVVLIPECDGVRILSNTSLEFLQRVPDSTESIFKIGSTSPAALLYDALDHFDRRSANGNDNLRLICSSLTEAVESFIDVAGHEFDVTRQRALLRAASYEKAFCSRLINAHCHLLALRISEYLDMNKEVMIMHWACAKITASPSIPDAHLLEILLDKLQLCKEISYAAVATHADNCGRRKLAAMLVEHEPRSTKQVSDKRWYWLKAFALATIKDWAALEKFSKEKRPPMGFRPFVEACIDTYEKAEALKYIPKLLDPVERGEAYARIGKAKEAAEANDEGELLERLRKTFSHNAIFDTLKMPFQEAS